MGVDADAMDTSSAGVGKLREAGLRRRVLLCVPTAAGVEPVCPGHVREDRRAGRIERSIMPRRPRYTHAASFAEGIPTP